MWKCPLASFQDHWEKWQFLSDFLLVWLMSAYWHEVAVAEAAAVWNSLHWDESGESGNNCSLFQGRAEEKIVPSFFIFLYWLGSKIFFDGDYWPSLLMLCIVETTFWKWEIRFCKRCWRKHSSYLPTSNAIFLTMQSRAESKKVFRSLYFSFIQ